MPSSESVVTPAAVDWFGPRPVGSDLKGRSVRGGITTLLAQGASHGLRLITTLVLARLLSPAEFGIVATVMSAIGILGLFREMGLSAATVQRPVVTESQVNTLFWINLALGAGAMVIAAAAAPMVLAFFGDQRLLGVTLAMSTTFLFNGLSTQHMALLRRQLRFTILARISVACTLASSLVSLALAAAGARYWALVVATVGSSVLCAILAWHHCTWRPQRPAFDSSVRGMFNFGRYLVVYGLVGFLAQNAHNVAIGKLWGAAGVGLYGRAYLLYTMLMSYVLQPPHAVAVSTLSGLRGEPERFRRVYLRILAVMMLVAIPLSAYLVLAAEDIVRLLLGPGWERSATILRWLALSGLVQPISFSSGWLYMSRGNSRGMMWWGIFGWTLLLLALLAGVPFGLEGVAAAYTLSQFFLVVPCMLYAFRDTPLHLNDLPGLIWRPAAAAAAAGAALLALRAQWPQLHWIGHMIVEGLAFAVVYGGLIGSAPAQRALIADILRQLRGGIPPPPV